MSGATIPTPCGPVRLRAETASDDSFRYTLFCQSRPSEWEALRADPELFERIMRHQFVAQDVGYRTQVPAAAFDIIERDDAPIGRIIVDRRPAVLHIVDQAILPKWRNRGIGTAIMRHLLDEATAAGLPVRLYVASDNDPSLRLYLRLGFRRIASSTAYIHLEWTA